MWFLASCEELLQNPTSSLVSLLSADADHSQFLQQLQRADLIDYLNELENVTLLAPVNSAYALDSSKGRLTQLDLDRMIIDTPVWPEDVEGTILFDTLARSINEHEQFLSTKVPILMKNDGTSNGTWFVENAHVLKDRYSTTMNAKLLSLDSFLMDPKLPLCQYFEESLNRDTSPREFNKFAQLISSWDTCADLDLFNGNLTVLIPSDGTDDMTQFNEIEWNYLVSMESQEDRHMYLGNYFVQGMIGGNLHSNWIKSFDLNGKQIGITSKYLGDALVINYESQTAVSTQANYILNDGILHYFENPLFFNESGRYQIEFTPRKYLIGLNQNEFVRELDLKGLHELIDNNGVKQTIFISEQSSSESFSVQNQIKNQLLYHFAQDFTIPDAEEENFHKLLNTLNCKGEKCQKVRVYKERDGRLVINDRSYTTKEPISIGSTTIYTVDEDIDLPSEFKVAIAKRKTGYARSANLLGNLDLPHDCTVLLPDTDAWENLGLVWKYLQSNHSKLKHLLKSFILNDSIYTDFEGAIETTNGLGEKVIVQSVDGEYLRLIYHSPEYKEFEIPLSWFNEILFQDGVIHALPEPEDDDLLLFENFPYSPSFEISLLDILSTQDHDLFDEIIQTMGFNNTYIMESGYSILLPPAKSLINTNLLTTWSPKKIKQFVSLHILPKESVGKIHECDPEIEIDTIDPLMKLSCRQLAGGERMLRISSGSDHEVRILNSGKTFPDYNQSVYILDKFVDPEWRNGDNSINIHLSWLAMLAAAALTLIITIFLICICAVFAGSGRKKLLQQQNVIPEEGTANERTPLVSVDQTMEFPDESQDNVSSHNGNSTIVSNHSKTSGTPINGVEDRSFSSEYSKNSKSHPRRIGSLPNRT